MLDPITAHGTRGPNLAMCNAHCYVMLTMFGLYYDCINARIVSKKESIERKVSLAAAREAHERAPRWVCIGSHAHDEVGYEAVLVIRHVYQWT